jgi:hypothetical protein
MAVSFINWLFPCKEHTRLEDELHIANARILELQGLLSDERQRYVDLKQSKADDWAAACKSAQAASSAIMDLQRQVFCMRGGGRRAGS